MALSLYDISVPVFTRGLAQLSHVLDKGLAHAQATGADPDAMVRASLTPDMFTLAGQVQCACDAAKACVARLAGLEMPSFPDTETTLAQLQERIAKTQTFLQGVERSQIDGQEERAISISKHGLNFKGQQYLLQYVLPNFFFHVTTAYAVLRVQGVRLGKRDFRGEF